MKSINCVVRLEDDKPIMFWYEVYLRGNTRFAVLECYTLADGHNEACHEYMRSLKPCPSDVASAFVSRYNYNVLDSKDAPNKLVKRLVRPKL